MGLEIGFKPHDAQGMEEVLWCSIDATRSTNLANVAENDAVILAGGVFCMPTSIAQQSFDMPGTAI